jgi:hypothetical protein
VFFIAFALDLRRFFYLDIDIGRDLLYNKHRFFYATKNVTNLLKIAIDKDGLAI